MWWWWWLEGQAVNEATGPKQELFASGQFGQY